MPNIKTIEINYCPVCKKLGDYKYGNLSDDLFGAKGKWNFYKCSNFECEAIWLNPRPQVEEIHKAYGSYYTHENENDSSRFKLFRILNRGFVTLSTTGVLAMLGLLPERRALASMLIDDCEGPGSLLEIGCGSGEYLNLMKKKGWDVEGIDFDQKAANAAMNKFEISVKVGSLESFDIKDDTYDVILMKHVIEHLFDPYLTFCEIFRILKKGGRLVLVTPNAKSLGLRVFGSSWRGLEPPRHIQIFTPNAIKKIAIHAGFENVEVRTATCNAWTFFLASLNIKMQHHKVNPLFSLSIFRLFKSLALQFKETILNRELKVIGEEIILKCIKT